MGVAVKANLNVPRFAIQRRRNAIFATTSAGPMRWEPTVTPGTALSQASPQQVMRI
jgi:hypothetical protein